MLRYGLDLWEGMVGSFFTKSRPGGTHVARKTVLRKYSMSIIKALLRFTPVSPIHGEWSTDESGNEVYGIEYLGRGCDVSPM